MDDRTLEEIQEERMKEAFSMLYLKACIEQVSKDARICSPRMKEIQELKLWYFKKEPTDAK